MAVVLLFLLAPFASGQVFLKIQTGGPTLCKQGCAKCHAIKGEGGKIGPDLGKIDLGDTQLNLAAKIWNHTPSMMVEIERTE